MLHIATVAFKFSVAISTSFVHHFIYLFLLFCVVLCVASSMLARWAHDFLIFTGDAPPPYYAHQQALPQQQQSVSLFIFHP